MSRRLASRAAVSVAAAAAVALVASACGAVTHTAGDGTPSPPMDLRDVAVPAAVTHTLAGADRAFAADLLRAAPAGGNLAMSPVSIATALQMVYLGARGTTATEMARVLHLAAASPQQTAAAAARLLRALRDDAGSGALDISDDTWAQTGDRLEPSFVSALASGFGAALHSTDFAHASDRSRAAINRTVADETHQRITDLMPPGSIDGSTRLVLTNAVFLKQRWETPFDTATPAAFHPQPDRTEQVPTMHLDGPLRYAAGAGWRAVEIPYAGGKLAMDIMVPTASGVPSLAALAHLHAAKQAYVDLTLPKFRFSWRADLVTLLQQLGMHAAFGNADFTGISRSEALHISVVQHQAKVAVDEQGTEAAAATGVGMAASGIVVPRRVVRFAVDQPFVFAVVDRGTDLPLFVGRVGDPAAG